MHGISYRKIDFSDAYWMEKIWRLRYDVYVQDRGFFQTENFSVNLESDEYDKQSLHFAAIDEDARVVGTTRLILPGQQTFPLRKNCGFIYQEETGSSYAEVSRLIVDKRLREGRSARKRCATPDNITYDDSLTNQNFACKATCVTLGLCGLVFEASLRYMITHWYALMERSLCLLFRTHGVNFKRIGAKVDVWGPVYPYVAEINSVEQSITNFLQRHSCPLLKNTTFAQ